MRNKVVIGTLLAGGVLLGVMLWHAGSRRDKERAVAGSGGESQRTGAPVPDGGHIPDAPSTAAAEAGDNKTSAGTGPEVRRGASDELQQAIAARAELNEVQLKTLHALLRAVSPEDAGQNGHVRKNALMNALNRQAKLPPDTLDLYATLYRDAAQNEVIRDYAIQHVYEAYDKLGDASQKAEAVRLLQEAAAQPGSSIAGTAILALARLAASDTNVPKADVAATAMDLARNPAANASARISALQVIGKLDEAQAVPVLVETVRAEQSIPVQLSAIGALGLVGGKDEMAMLRAVAGGDNARLKPAALAALKRIQERTGEL